MKSLFTSSTRFRFCFLVLVTVLLLSVNSCNILFNIISRSSGGGTVPSTLVARISVDNTSIAIGDTFTLDASGSTVPAGTLPSYQWTLTERPRYSTAVIDNSSEVFAYLTPDRVGSYYLSLTVTSGNNSNTVSIVLTVSGEATLALSTTSLSLQVGSTSEFTAVARSSLGDFEPLSNILVLNATLASTSSIYQDGQTIVLVSALASGSTSIVITSASGKQLVVSLYIQDPPVVGEASLLLTQEVVNLYVGAVIRIDVLARDYGGSIEPVEITSHPDSAFASASVSNTAQGSIVTISGEGFGSTSLTVTSLSGKSGNISIWVKSEEMNEAGATIGID